MNVADPHRTLIDILDVPASAGGVLHAFRSPAGHISKASTPTRRRLLEYGDRLGRGTMFKRLGYLAENEGVSLTTTS